MNGLQSVAQHEPQIFPEADEKYAVIKAYLVTAEAQGMSHGDVEQWLEREGRELMRPVYQSHLNERGSREPTEAVIGADGTPRNHKRVEARRLMTVFGPVEVRRRGYSARLKPSVYPLDAELNLPTKLHSAGVRRRLCQEAAKGSFD